MQTTFERMTQARAVLSISHVNDEIHNRTVNGLNAGCVNIVEDNAIHRRLFADRKDALFFRYDDGSLQACLDLVWRRSAARLQNRQKGIQAARPQAVSLRRLRRHRHAGADAVAGRSRARPAMTLGCVVAKAI